MDLSSGPMAGFPELCPRGTTRAVARAFALQLCSTSRGKVPHHTQVSGGRYAEREMQERDASSYCRERKRYYKGRPFISEANKISLRVATLPNL